MRRSFVFKVKMSPSAARRAQRQLDLCRELHNACIEERREAWRRQRVSVRRFDQQGQLPEIRRIRPEFAELDAQLLGMVVYRVALAFDGFFRRVKAGQTPGYPRFKSRSRFDSVTYRQSGWKLDGNRLTLRYVGTVKLFLSREIQGTIKTVTLRRDRCGDWFVCFSCEGVPARPLPETGRAVGVDLGLHSFIATSDGEAVEAPQPYRTAEAALARALRRRSKMKRGGSNYREQSRRIAKLHRRVARVRRDFHFKTALDLVRRYDAIAVEDLNVRGLARSRLAKSVRDAGWADFLHALRSKAEEAARSVVVVDARGTSQVCSGCGCEPEQRKTLAVRTHRCTDCGLVLDRDVNAAINVLSRAGAQLAASRPASRAAA